MVRSHGGGLGSSGVGEVCRVLVVLFLSQCVGRWQVRWRVSVDGVLPAQVGGQPWGQTVGTRDGRAWLSAKDEPPSSNPALPQRK